MQRRRGARFPIEDIEFACPGLPGEVVELSRTGLRLRTAIAIDEGQSIGGVLSFKDEKVELRGVVRWRREAGFATKDDTLAFWEIGVAFTEIGEVSPDGLWRTLTAHAPGEPGRAEP